MSRYLGPKVKLSRKVGVPVADIPKHTSKRQLTTPGMHGFRGRRQKDYGIRKDEKQKLRLDNVLRRAGFSRTIWGARQLCAHGHVLVNGKKVDRPSYAIEIGDIVTLREGIQKLAREQMESIPGHQVPGWIAVNPSELSAKCVSMPTSDQIPFDVNTNLIVEFYR